MNKKHESLSVQANKKERKEVKRGIKEASSIEEPKTPPVIVAKKKTKTATKEPTDSPQHVKCEGSRWVSMLKRQSAETHVRMTKKQLKPH